MTASRENFPLLAELLAEQQRLDTPVARFSSAHDSNDGAELSNFSSRRASLSPQLLPFSKPSPGEQYAFEVDLDSCTGCKSCVAACHSLNGLDDEETWRDVGVLVSASRKRPFAQTVTTACHHCADPACLNGCPVLAYEKDPVTGIVRHLDDQCIGCSYCILKCPYDVPKFSSRLGIVRKCDMCHSRLAAGEAPACAQACPTHAIRIVNVSTAARSAEPAAVGTEPSRRFPFEFLPAAPDPSYTQPTTRYITRRAFPDDLVAADGATLRVQPPHWPLVVMLTLLPAAVGLACAAAFLPVELSRRELFWANVASCATGAVGLGASVFHLGKPLRAWRIFLGWRKSWLSREAMVFGAWLPIAATAPFQLHFSMASAVIGCAGLACSSMIYVDTRRHFWRASQTWPRLFGTAAIIGLSPFAPRVAAAMLLGKIVWESRTFLERSISARLQRGPLSRAVRTRDLLGLLGATLLVVAPVWLALIFVFAGELAERYLFFRAVDAPKMPGVAA
jgi:formate dehydrogenase iron-sulfur subunit